MRLNTDFCQASDFLVAVFALAKGFIFCKDPTTSPLPYVLLNAAEFLVLLAVNEW